jgi:AraC-like DNA-binding protein
MLRFSTDEVAPGDRFEQWREVRSKGLFGVTIEMPPERRQHFSGSFRAEKVGGAVASEMRASSYVVRLTEADIARVSGNSLCISLQVRGPGALDTGKGRIERIGNGDIAINHSDLPYTGIPEGESGFHLRMLKIPVSDELLLGQSPFDLFAARPAPDSRSLRPLRALFDALTLRRHRIAEPERDVVHIARLAMAARGRLAENLPEVRRAVRAGSRYLALAIMATEFHRADLAPAGIAQRLGISLRHLHMLFEESEHTFSRTLAMLRAAAAHRLLVEHPSMAVAHVAHVCGFESPATFYRVFTGIYGAAPGDVRKQSAIIWQ